MSSARKLAVVPAQRCTGQCCERFPLSTCYQLSAVEVMEHLRNGTLPPTQGFGPVKKVNWAPDTPFVIDMLLPLHGPTRDDDISMAYFTCRHFDGKDCTVYDKRPELCRQHGVSSPCDHVGNGCTQPGAWKPQKSDG